MLILAQFIKKVILRLPLRCKIFEIVIYNQLGEYMDLFLKKVLCGFRKAHSSQHALFKLLLSWQNELDNSGFIGTILMDLSKAYDCLPHNLIIAKFEVYGLSKNTLKLLLDFLEGRKQRVKIGSNNSNNNNTIYLFNVEYKQIAKKSFYIANKLRLYPRRRVHCFN